MTRTAFLLLAALLLAAACASHRTYNVVKPVADAPTYAASDPASVEISEGPPAQGRSYAALGRVIVTVSKTTAFDKNPTRDQVDEQLRLEAGKLGADAVVEVVYDGPKIGFASWSVMDGSGTAIKYTD